MIDFLSNTLGLSPFMVDLISTFYDGLLRPFTFLTIPTQRLFIPALFTSFLMAVGAYYYYKSKGRVGDKGMFAYIFPKSIWTHYSSFVDFKVFLFSSLIFVFVTAPFLILSATALTDSIRSLWIGFFGEAAPTSFSSTTILIAYTVAMFLVVDFFRFFAHWLFHVVPILWPFHKVHHSAIVMNPVTLHRIHPVESVAFHLHRVFSFSLVTGTFLYLFGNDLSILNIVYANMLRTAFNLVGSNLRHMHIWVSWGNFMEHIFISPAQHQIHHSEAPEHRDKNMGSAFSFWDWMFGTLVIAAGDEQELSLGLGEEENKRYATFWQNIINPFVDFWRKFTTFQILKAA